MAKVLVAFDGSETAMKAVSYAADMVLKHPITEVTVLLVVNTGHLDFFEATLDIREKYTETIIESGQNMLKRAKKVFDDKNLPVKTIIEQGDPAGAINSFVNKNAIDMIIMGTRGLTSLKGMVLGSVSQKLIHLSDKPVLLIK